MSGGLVREVGCIGDWLERLGEWGTGWRCSLQVPSQVPLKVPISICVFLNVCLFVCFQTGIPLPVYFLFLSSVFKQPSTYAHICSELSEIKSE